MALFHPHYQWPFQEANKLEIPTICIGLFLREYLRKYGLKYGTNLLTYLHRILKFPRPGGWSQTPSWWLRERRFPGCAQQLRHWDERMALNGGRWMGNEWDMTSLMFHFRVVGLFFGFSLTPFRYSKQTWSPWEWYLRVMWVWKTSTDKGKAHRHRSNLTTPSPVL